MLTQHMKSRICVTICIMIQGLLFNILRGIGRYTGLFSFLCLYLPVPSVILPVTQKLISARYLEYLNSSNASRGERGLARGAMSKDAQCSLCLHQHYVFISCLSWCRSEWVKWLKKDYSKNPCMCVTGFEGFFIVLSERVSLQHYFNSIWAKWNFIDSCLVVSTWIFFATC